MPTTPNKLFKTTWLPDIVARIFARRPRETIWQWAERNVFLDSKMAPEPTFYDSRKTPWTRRIQELWQHPYHNGRRIRRIVVKKSSQTGFTEAVLNCMRWDAKFSPRNCIYAIDSQEEAANISERFRATLDSLGESILTDDKKDVTTRKMTLLHQIVWFLGSGASGKFANKQAPRVVTDEIEEYKKLKGETSTVGNAASRMKKSAEGLLVELSKPKLKGGPIDADHALGNQEIFLVPCPHCGTYQEIVWERLVFKHCKNLMGEWDKDRVLNETYLECARNREDISAHDASLTNCPPILESHRYQMVQQGRWFPTGVGSKTYDPEVVSQEMSDLYDVDNPRVWGEIAKEMISVGGDHKLRQEKWNHRLGRAYEILTIKPAVRDILACKFPYHRGTIPWPPLAVIIGGDVGQYESKWAAIAISASDDFALIDWGKELAPGGVAAAVKEKRYRSPSEDKFHEVWQAVICARYNKEDVYSACEHVPGRMWPVMGGGTERTRQAFAWVGIPTYPRWMKLLNFNDRDFKMELYLQRIKRFVPPDLNEIEARALREKMPRLLVPEDIPPDVIEEFIHEPFIDGEFADRTGPNHWGDCVKNVCVFWRWASRAVFKRAPLNLPQTTSTTEEETGDAPAIAA